jgi:hypothetical protein
MVGIQILHRKCRVPLQPDGLQYRLGDLAHLKVLNTDFIVINSHAIAVDLLDKRGAIYSDRPYLAMSADLSVSLRGKVWQ